MSLRTRLWNLLARHRRDDDLRDEVETHLALLEEDGRDHGLDGPAARRAARVRFGNPVAYREQAVDAGMSVRLDGMWRDLRYALRTLRRDRGFTATAVCSLALGIGANTATFSVLDAVLLRPLPVRHADELLVIDTGGDASLPVFRALRDGTHAFLDLLASSEPTVMDVDAGGGPERTTVALVSGSYFATLGVGAAAGRTLMADDDREHSPVAVASDGYWARRFGRDPALVGRTVMVGVTPVTIVGVTPRAFSGERVGVSPDLWLPLAMQPLIDSGRDLLHSPATAWLRMIGRRRPGVDPIGAAAELTPLYRQTLIDSFGATLQADTRRLIERATVTLTPGSTGLSALRPRFSGPLQVLMAVVALLLLIACANVANMLLARAEARRREIGLRLALGVGRVRLIQQLLIESVLLSGISAGVGLLVAAWGQRLLLRLASSGAAMVRLTVGLDARVLLFVVAIAAVTGLLFGLAPAWQSTRMDLVTALRTKSGPARPRRVALGPALVVGQVALSVVLLVNAGLFLRTLDNLRRADLGFAPEGLLIVDVDPRATGYGGERLADLCARLLQRLQSAPGIAQVSFSANGVLTARDSSTRRMRPEGFVAAADGVPQARFDAVGPGYLRTMGITLMAGRDFDARDSAGAPRAVIISAGMATRYFDGLNPVGRTMLWGSGASQQALEIVGIAGDVKQRDARDDMRLRFYVPYAQQASRSIESVRFVMRGAGGGTGPESLRRLVLTEDPRLVVASIDTGAVLAEGTLAHDRMVATLASGFALLALTLTCVGLYGLLAYRVAQRTGEIGIRLALGATRTRVVWAVARLDLALVAGGLVLGGPLAVAASSLTMSLLYGVEPADPRVLALVISAVAAAGLLAGAVPGLRASRVEPTIALRHD